MQARAEPAQQVRMQFQTQAQETNRHDKNAPAAQKSRRKTQVEVHLAVREKEQAADYAKESPTTRTNWRIKAKIGENVWGKSLGS